MAERTRILVCGDAGPARHALLLRRDIELLWTDSAESAIATIRSAMPKVCLVRPTLAKGSALELLAAVRTIGGPPTVVLLHPNELHLRGECLAAGAVEVVEIARAEPVLQMIGQYTGLQFALDPRVPYR